MAKEDVGGWLSVGAGVLWIFSEGGKRWLLEKVSHVIDITVSQNAQLLVQFGPPIVLALIALFLLSPKFRDFLKHRWWSIKGANRADFELIISGENLLTRADPKANNILCWNCLRDEQSLRPYCLFLVFRYPIEGAKLTLKFEDNFPCKIVEVNNRFAVITFPENVKIGTVYVKVRQG